MVPSRELQRADSAYCIPAADGSNPKASHQATSRAAVDAVTATWRIARGRALGTSAISAAPRTGRLNSAVRYPMEAPTGMDIPPLFRATAQIGGFGLGSFAPACRQGIAGWAGQGAAASALIAPHFRPPTAFVDQRSGGRKVRGGKDRTSGAVAPTAAPYRSARPACATNQPACLSFLPLVTSPQSNRMTVGAPGLPSESSSPWAAGDPGRGEGRDGPHEPQAGSRGLASGLDPCGGGARRVRRHRGR